MYFLGSKKFYRIPTQLQTEKRPSKIKVFLALVSFPRQAAAHLLATLAQGPDNLAPFLPHRQVTSTNVGSDQLGFDSKIVIGFFLTYITAITIFDSFTK